MCRSCPRTYCVPIYRQVSSLLVHFARVRVSSSIPASSLLSVRSQNSVDCWCCACFHCILRVLLACRARDFCGLGIGFVFFLFLSVWFRPVSVKSGTLGFCCGRGGCFSWCGSIDGGCGVWFLGAERRPGFPAIWISCTAIWIFLSVSCFYNISGFWSVL
jgi:hypothetical protein